MTQQKPLPDSKTLAAETLARRWNVLSDVKAAIKSLEQIPFVLLTVGDMSAVKSLKAAEKALTAVIS